MSILSLRGDCRRVLSDLPDSSVHCCVTSPPYYGLRDYGVAGQIGLEATPDAYVAELVAVFREVRRVLRPDGTCWLNLGDSYAGSWGARGRGLETNAARPDLEGKHVTSAVARNGFQHLGIKPKDLLGIPWMVAFALRADGWWLRKSIIWAKGNAMPESVFDRPSSSHENVFLLTKAEKYSYDWFAIAEDAVSDHPSGNGFKCDARKSYSDANGARGSDKSWSAIGGKRNARDVWQINVRPFKGAHFATMPPQLAEQCVRLGRQSSAAARTAPHRGKGSWSRVTRSWRCSAPPAATPPADIPDCRRRITRPRACRTPRT